MTLKFIDLYNAAASQEWSMYDNDAKNTEEFEKALVMDLNKAVTEILYSFPFSFRERTHVLFTLPNEASYDMPSGLIIKDKSDNYCVKLNSKTLSLIENPKVLGNLTGIPDGFYIKGDKIILYPAPAEKLILTIDYMTLAVGENSSGDDIFALKNDSDILNVPTYLEEIFKNAVITRAMLNAISSEDENYSAYKKQAEKAYKLLVKYSKGVGQEKAVAL